MIIRVHQKITWLAFHSLTSDASPSEEALHCYMTQGDPIEVATLLE